MALFVSLIWGISTSQDTNKTDNLIEAKEFLNKLDKQYAEWNNKLTIAEWKYASNLTKDNLEEKLNVSSKAAQYFKSAWQEVNQLIITISRNRRVKRRLY